MMRKRIKSDEGVASSIEMIIIIVFLFGLITTVMDIGIYFNNRSVIASAAQNGARLASIYGGSGNTKIAQAYGVNDITPACSAVGATSPVECSVVQELREQKGAVNATIRSVKCGPLATTKVGERTWCEIKYKYNGIPGSALSLINLRHDNTVRVSEETETILTN